MATKIKYRKMALADYLETVDRGMTTTELAAVLGVALGHIEGRSKWQQSKSN